MLNVFLKPVINKIDCHGVLMNSDYALWQYEPLSRFICRKLTSNNKTNNKDNNKKSRNKK